MAFRQYLECASFAPLTGRGTAEARPRRPRARESRHPAGAGARGGVGRRRDAVGLAQKINTLMSGFGSVSRTYGAGSHRCDDFLPSRSMPTPYRGNSMKQILAALFVLLIAPVSHAATFTYTSGALNTASTISHTTCTLGSCADFNNTMHATGSITTTALPANQSNLNPQPYLTAFTFFDGITTYNSADPNVRANWTVDTDASGNITFVNAIFQRWQSGSAPHSAGARIDMLRINGPAIGWHNRSCLTLGSTGFPQNVADYCISDTPDSNSSYGDYATANWTVSAGPPAATTSVPTLSEWGLMILSTLLGIFAVTHMRRRV